MNLFSIDLIEACKRHDRKAQLQLYNQYCQGMYSVAKRFISNTAEAEDLVQDAFIKAFSKLHQFKGDVTFGAWLKRIVVNTCIDALKSKKHDVDVLEEVHLKVVDADTHDNWTVDDGVTLNDIKRVIETLPEKYKYVVMLFLIEGYDHQEISEILNISEVASRTQLSRGKQKLQELLKMKDYGTGY
ncbi:RNA polymerase sigma factor [Formosa agariphila]|nr:RNA polymerase sigma factor [Formosa agariphila]